MEKNFESVEAGEVIYIKYKGENKPCDSAMCIALFPIEVKDGKVVGDLINTAFSIDLDTMEFTSDGVRCDLSLSYEVVRGRKLKEWYFKKVSDLCKKNREKKNMDSHTIEYWLRYYGMAEEKIDAATQMIVQDYGASRYLEGVNDGADAVNNRKNE